MTPRSWLRIASIIALIFATGHALGGINHWSPLGDNPVLQSMQTVHFEIMGVRRSYFDFYVGFGHSLTVMMVLQAVVLWQLAVLAGTNAVVVRPIVAAIGVATAVGGVIAWRFIFPVPALFSLGLVACLALAYVATYRATLHLP
jgi:hypothetical protein